MNELKMPAPAVPEGMELMIGLAQGLSRMTLTTRPAPAVQVLIKHHLAFGPTDAATRLPVYIRRLDNRGDSAWWPVNTSPASDDYSLQASPGETLLFVSALTGALICTKTIGAGGNPQILELLPQDLLAPNRIGGFPRSVSNASIPLDSQRILVSLGNLPNGNVVTREQYWKHVSDSFSMAGNSTRTVAFWKKTGRESTSSTQEALSASVSANVSGGWGPVSASLSASLSANSSTFHQVTVNEETTIFESIAYQNAGASSAVIHFWQLTDVTTVFAKDLRPIAVISNGQAPLMIDVVGNNP